MNRVRKQSIVQFCLVLCLSLVAPMAVAFEVTGGAFRPLTVRLDMPVETPFRLGYLTDPMRVVIDLEVDELTPAAQGQLPRDVLALRSGRIIAGWSRIVLETETPQRLVRTEAGSGAENTGLTLVFGRTGMADFADLAARQGPAPIRASDIAAEGGDRSRPTLVIDPGHGGIDPGAIRNGIAEKTLALSFAMRLRKELQSSDKYNVILTREHDIYLTLAARTDMARHARANLFLSIHANTVVEGDASGSTVYLLSDVATDAHARALAAKENRSDMIAGLDLSGQSDALTQTILDLSQAQTNANSRAFGELLVNELRDATGVIRSAPLRGANFKVLRAPEVPSALLELGFLSNAEDLALMQNPIWQKFAAEATARAIDSWLRGADREQNPAFLQTVSGK